MKHDDVIAHCMTFPGATHDRPFGPGTEVMKVGGKMFAAWGSDPGGVSLKLKDADTARFLMDIGVAKPAPYLKRGGWAMIAWDEESLKERLRDSYEIVRKGLTKKAQAELGS